MQAIVEFTGGCDIIVSSPTGFGKLLIYGLLPVVIKRLQKTPDKPFVADTSVYIRLH